MYALPRADAGRGASTTSTTAIALGAAHISAYHLTLEPNTPFHHAPPPLPDDDLAADMQEMVEETLAAAGYEHYETSAFAQPGRRMPRTTSTTGASATISASAPARTASCRSTSASCARRATRSPRAYLEGAAAATSSGTPAGRRRADLPGEFMMNALRLTEGFPPRLFAERTGLPLAAIEKSALAARREGLLETVDGHDPPDAARPALPQPAAGRVLE